jgi:hypothetical protein
VGVWHQSGVLNRSFPEFSSLNAKPDFLPNAIKHLELTLLHCRLDMSPSPDKYCWIHEEVSGCSGCTQLACSVPF